MVKINNLNFSYSKKPVLKYLNAKINEGDFIGIIGPNGSGKSTLLRCIDGILPVNTGTIFIDNTDIRHYSRNKLSRKIAFVPQHENQVFAPTVYDTVLLGRKPYIGWAPRKADHKITIDVIQQLDLEEISLECINELSGGQRQRVFIARALAQQPEILLMDEPSANLDLKHQLEVFEILKKLASDGITIAVALHDLNLAAKYCESLLMLNEGEVFASGGKNILTSENIEKLYGVKVRIINTNGDFIIIPEKPLK